MPADDLTHPLWSVSGDPLRRGDELGRYLVLHELGRGGMGVVYAAYDPELDRKVAVKLLRPGRARRRDEQARLLREAQALARLSHPNVIQVYDAGTVGEQVFLAMELVEGEPLDEWLRREARPWRQVLAVFQAAGRGLAAAHAVGLVHRDFKPANVLLGNDERVRVLDFGVARPADEPAGEEPTIAEKILAEAANLGRVRLSTPLTRAGFVVGTPRYMAPEVIRGRRFDHRADQFAFCVSLFEALYGIPPFPGETLPDLLAQAKAGKVQEPPAASRVPSWVFRILLRGLATDPEQRYPSMDELLADLARDRSALLRRRAGVAALLALLAAGGLAFYGMERGRDRLCTGAEGRLAGIWDAGRKAAVRRAFLASGRPYAVDAWRGVERTLDVYTDSWIAQRTEACLATHVRGEQSPELLDLRMLCLDRRLREVRELTGLFASGGPAMVERAVQASQNLSSLDECSDPSALTGPLKPPAGPAAHRAIERANARIAQARTLWITGRYADGLPVADEAVAAAARTGYPPVQAEALRVRSQLEDSAGRPESAAASLFEALEAAEKGHHDALAARAWTDLAFLSGFRQQRFDEGRRWARMAEASLARLGGAAANPELDADLKSNLGSVLDLQGDHQGGLALLLQALALYEKALGPDHPSVGRTLNRVGNAYYQLHRYPEALDAYQRALAQTRRMLGPQHPTVAVRLGNIALVLEAQGRYEESLRTQLAALAIEEQALGPNHPRLSITHGNLSALLLVMGLYGEALSHAWRALAIDQANPDAAPADLGASFLNVADCLYKLGRYDEALAHNRRARILLVQALGDKHPWTAEAEATYGKILYAQNHPAQAVPPLRRAVAGFDAAGEETTENAMARFYLARALWGLGGDRTEALALARQARQILARTRPDALSEVEGWLAGRR
jgi:tetratricopeptide (TPR) repeat protein/predicted Ser/Thr protein kinase